MNDRRSTGIWLSRQKKVMEKHARRRSLGIGGVALLIALLIGFNQWCGNSLASLAVLTGHGRDILIPTRPAWKTHIAPAYWQGSLLPAETQQYRTARGYVVVVEHRVGPMQTMRGPGDVLPPTAAPMPGVAVSRHVSASALASLEEK